MKNQDVILRKDPEIVSGRTDLEISHRDTEELNAQFGEFLRTKGIKAKFHLAVENMRESAVRQHAVDCANFEAVRARSAEENADFVEFLHTKGAGAKARLVVENIKRGAAEAKHPQRSSDGGSAAPAVLPDGDAADGTVDAGDLTEMFQTFLREKGLDGQFEVEVTENECP